MLEYLGLYNFRKQLKILVVAELGRFLSLKLGKENHNKAKGFDTQFEQSKSISIKKHNYIYENQTKRFFWSHL